MDCWLRVYNVHVLPRPKFNANFIMDIEHDPNPVRFLHPKLKHCHTKDNFRGLIGVSYTEVSYYSGTVIYNRHHWDH